MTTTVATVLLRCPNPHPRIPGKECRGILVSAPRGISVLSIVGIVADCQRCGTPVDLSVAKVVLE